MAVTMLGDLRQPRCVICNLTAATTWSKRPDGEPSLRPVQQLFELACEVPIEATRHPCEYVPAAHNYTQRHKARYAYHGRIARCVLFHEEIERVTPVMRFAGRAHSVHRRVQLVRVTVCAPSPSISSGSYRLCCLALFSFPAQYENG
jgi:hypothetical protein